MDVYKNINFILRKIGGKSNSVNYKLDFFKKIFYMLNILLNLLKDKSKSIYILVFGY